MSATTKDDVIRGRGLLTAAHGNIMAYLSGKPIPWFIANLGELGLTKRDTKPLMMVKTAFYRVQNSCMEDRKLWIEVLKTYLANANEEKWCIQLKAERDYFLRKLRTFEGTVDMCTVPGIVTNETKKVRFTTDYNSHWTSHVQLSYQNMEGLKSVSGTEKNLGLILADQQTILLGKKDEKSEKVSLLVVDRASMETKTIGQGKQDWPGRINTAAYHSGLIILSSRNHGSDLYRIDIKHGTSEPAELLSKLSDADAACISRRYICIANSSELEVYSRKEIGIWDYLPLWSRHYWFKHEKERASHVDIRRSKLVAISDLKIIYWWHIKKGGAWAPYRIYHIDKKMARLDARTLLNAATGNDSEINQNMHNILEAKTRTLSEITEGSLVIRTDARCRYIAVCWFPPSGRSKIQPPKFRIYDAEDDMKTVSSFGLDSEEIKEFGDLRDFTLEGRTVLLLFQRGFCQIWA